MSFRPHQTDHNVGDHGPSALWRQRLTRARWLRGVPNNCGSKQRRICSKQAFSNRNACHGVAHMRIQRGEYRGRQSHRFRPHTTPCPRCSKRRSLVRCWKADANMQQVVPLRCLCSCSTSPNAASSKSESGHCSSSARKQAFFLETWLSLSGNGCCLAAVPSWQDIPPPLRKRRSGHSPAFEGGKNHGWTLIHTDYC